MQVSFDIYNKDAVDRLREENPDILPTYSVDSDADLAYNKSQINGAIESAIIQGKSIDHISDDLQKRMESVNRSSAVRTARTATTCAQNAGNLDSFYKAQEMGIATEKQWVCTQDDRTRESHLELDGEHVPLDEEFSNGLQYPGDPSGDPSEVYNCRCTMVAYFPETDESTSEEDESEQDYEDWLEEKQVIENINEEDDEPSIPAAYDGDFSDYSELELSEQEVQSLKELNYLAKENQYEYAQIFYNGGACTETFTSSQYDCVDLSAQKNRINSNDLKIYHSHTNATPLSAQDFRQLVNPSVEQVGVIARNGDVYVAKIGDGYRPSKEEFDETAENIKYEVDNEFYWVAIENQWTAGEAKYMAIKEQGYRIARAFKWTYMGGRINE